MSTNQERLNNLKLDLDNTYREMRTILERNNIPRRLVTGLPKDEYEKWYSLNRKSINLISEFIQLISESIELRANKNPGFK
jgi:hypothetical protein